MSRKPKSLAWIIPPLVLLLSLLPGLASAQGSDPTDDEVNAVARQLYCPVCENVPLDACGTAACEQWRGIIRDKLAQGWTEDQIKDYFVAQYGDRVLAEPPRKGFNWLVYLVPLLVFAGGLVLLYQGLRRWRSAAGVDQTPAARTPKPPRADSSPDEYIDKVEEALKKRSGGSG